MNKLRAVALAIAGVAAGVCLKDGFAIGAAVNAALVVYWIFMIEG